MANKVMKASLFFGSSLGFGFLPKMPGTWGTIPAVLIGIGVYYCVTDETLFRICVLGWLLIVSGIGFFVLPVFYEFTKESDPKKFTLDEMAGYFIVLLFLGRNVPLWFLSAGGFIVFRFFDIVKPPGAWFFDKKLRGFVSIMGDDMISGIYSAFVLYFAKLIFLR